MMAAIAARAQGHKLEPLPTSYHHIGFEALKMVVVNARYVDIPWFERRELSKYEDLTIGSQLEVRSLAAKLRALQVERRFK